MVLAIRLTPWTLRASGAGLGCRIQLAHGRIRSHSARVASSLSTREAGEVAIEYTRLVRTELAGAELAELAVVDEYAGRLRAHLERNFAAIDGAHVYNAQSAEIQRLVGEMLGEVGFREEVVLTPERGFVTQARPDFFFRLSDGRGIIAEVERGGTVNNNHDLKDIWKTHIAQDAQHLFLIVPNCNFKSDGSPREKPFVRVVHRAASFFGEPRRELDIVSLHVFGYGRAS